MVLDGVVRLDAPAANVQVGLAFRHEIEPLPADLITPGGAATGPLRLVAVTFRLLETAALSVDLGRGAEPAAFRRLDTALLDAPPAPFTGDVLVQGNRISRVVKSSYGQRSTPVLGATTICLTSDAASPVATAGDVRLLTAGCSFTDEDHNTYARLGQLAIVDLLYAGMMVSLKR